ncbi:MAG TPA: MarR family winged helix-turn-helix transcriptional regulator, partial [Candidatus Elarobacter sp.]
AKPDCGVGELADWLDMDISTATRVLRPLRAEGYVTIRPSATDARRREVRLTAKGRRTLSKARPLWQRAQSEVIGELGERRWESLLTLLRAIA